MSRRKPLPRLAAAALSVIALAATTMAAAWQPSVLEIGPGTGSCPASYLCVWENRDFAGRGVAILGTEADWGALPGGLGWIDDNAESYFNNGSAAHPKPDLLLWEDPGFTGPYDPLPLCNGKAFGHIENFGNLASSNQWEDLRGIC